MRDFQRQKETRSRWARWLFSPLAVMVLAASCVFLGRAVWDLAGKEMETAEKMRGEQAKAEELAAAKGVLSSQVTHLGTPEGIDEAIRSTYNVIKPGERLVVIMGASTTTGGQ
jgi:cell division protein FtsB